MEQYLADETNGIELLYRGHSLDNIPFSDVTNYNKYFRYQTKLTLVRILISRITTGK